MPPLSRRAHSISAAFGRDSNSSSCSSVAIHLMAALDRLFDVDDWDADFSLPEASSFATFLRLILHLHPTKRPGLGLSARGHILASWSKDRDRIVIECLANDELRWVLSQSVAGSRESAAGKNRIHRLIDLIEGYQPDRFFRNGDETIA